MNLPTAPARAHARPFLSRPTHLVDGPTWGLAVANLTAQITLIFTGGLVRLTGSGLGCSTWPLCEPGNFTPVFHEAASFHPFVEFGNRTLTGVLAAIAVALLWAVHRREPVRSRPRIFRVLAWTIIGGIALQAVIGGLSVLWELHPALVGSHMYSSLILVAISAYLVARLRQEDYPATPPNPPLRQILWALLTVGGVLLVLGVVTTGTGPHSGDDNAPYRFALDPLIITRTHSAAMWLFVGLLAAAVWVSRRQGVQLSIWLPTIILTATQGAIGYLQYFTGLPILLVLAHMLAAALFVAALTIAATGLHPRPVT